MERLEVEDHEGNGMQFEVVNEIHEDIESDCSTVGDNAGCFMRWWRGHAYSPFKGGGEMELTSVFDESCMDEREDMEIESVISSRRNGGRSCKTCVRSKKFCIPCLVVSLLVLYTVLCVALMAGAGRGINIDYLGNASLDLTCNTGQAAEGDFRFTRNSNAKVALTVRGAVFKFKRSNGKGYWGSMRPSGTLKPTSSNKIRLVGAIEPIVIEELQAFLSEYLNWRLMNTTRPQVLLTLTGDLGSSFFPFWIPITVHTAIQAPLTANTFAVHGASVDIARTTRVSLNVTEDGFYAWNKGLPLGFTVDSLHTTFTASYTPEGSKALDVVSTNGTSLGTLLASPNVAREVFTVKGVTGKCLPQQVVGGVQFQIPASHFLKKNSNITVAGVDATLNSAILKDTTLLANITVNNGQTPFPIALGGPGMALTIEAAGDAEGVVEVIGPAKPQELSQLELDVLVPGGTRNVVSSLVNRLEVPELCLRSNQEWLESFLLAIGNMPCMSAVASPGYGLWNVLFEPQAYIKQALQVTDRHLTQVTDDTLTVTLAQAWPAAIPLTLSLLPLKLQGVGVPNITVGEVTVRISDVLFDVTLSSRPSALDEELWDLITAVKVHVSKQEALQGIIGGSSSSYGMEIAMGGLMWEDCLFEVPSWAGMLRPWGVANPFPVSFHISKGFLMLRSENGSHQLYNTEAADVGMQMFSPSYDPENTTIPWSPTTHGGLQPALLTPICISSLTPPAEVDYSCICDNIDDTALCGLTWGMLPDEVCDDLYPRPSAQTTLYQTCPSQCQWCSSTDNSTQTPSIPLA